MSRQSRLCVDCKVRIGCRPGKLCKTCYRVRKGEAPRQNSQVMFNFDPTKEPAPTSVLPGFEKLEVLAARYAAGERLWSEKDAVRE